MAPVKEQKVLKLNNTNDNRKNAGVAGKLIILAVAVILALIVSQWNEVVSLLPKMDNKVYKIAQTDMGQHIVHSFGNKNMAYIGKNGLVVMDKKGREKFSVSMIMDSPSIAVSDSKIVFAPKGKNSVFTVTSSISTAARSISDLAGTSITEVTTSSCSERTGCHTILGLAKLSRAVQNGGESCMKTPTL